MKPIIILLLFICFIKCSFGQSKKELLFQNKTLNHENITAVDAETTGGSISVFGVQENDAHIEIYLQTSNYRNISKEEILKRFNSDYTLTVSTINHKLTAIARKKESLFNLGLGLSISFKIYVPKASSTNLITSGGNITINDMSNGTLEFVTSGGNLVLNNLHAKVRGKTSGGNIYLKGSSQNIEVITSGGNIEAENDNGDINLSTSGGNVNLRNLSGSINASTSGGSVNADHIEGSLVTTTSGGNLKLINLMCTLDGSTSGGNIDVTISKTGKYIKLHNSGGDTNLEVPNGMGFNIKMHGNKVNMNPLSIFKGESDEHNMNGTINGGGVLISMNGGDHVTLNIK